MHYFFSKIHNLLFLRLSLLQIESYYSINWVTILPISFNFQSTSSTPLQAGNKRYLCTNVSSKLSDLPQLN